MALSTFFRCTNCNQPWDPFHQCAPKEEKKKKEYRWNYYFTYENLSGIEPEPKDKPVILSCGLGRDSVSMLMLLTHPFEASRWAEINGLNPYPIRQYEDIDAVFFADPGGERPHTYALLDPIAEHCRQHDLPFYRVKYWSPTYGSDSLLDEKIRDGTVPFLPQAMHTCSVKYKVDPQKNLADWLFHGVETVPNNRLKGVNPQIGKLSQKRLKPSYRATFLVGIHAAESKRIKGGSGTSYAVGATNDPHHNSAFPLIDIGVSDAHEPEILQSWGPQLGNVRKSACFFCPYMKEGELCELINEYPEQWEQAKTIESNFQRMSTEKFESGAWSKNSYADGARLFWASKLGSVAEIESKLEATEVYPRVRICDNCGDEAEYDSGVKLEWLWCYDCDTKEHLRWKDQ